MKVHEFERLAPLQRRRFLKLMGAALAAPFVPSAVRYACNEIAGDAKAGESGLPTYFIEIDLRDQWDFGHVFVAPGLATYANLKRGENGRKAAVFYEMNELVQKPNNIYLTPESMALESHVDNIALVETCELSEGAIHGHEAGNPVRSPGRSYDSTGKMPMFKNDPVSNFPQGCEEFYSTTPTPATMHNYIQKQADATLRNGMVFKGISRSIHTVYHFASTLQSAELDRIQSKDSLFQAFPETVQDLNIVPTTEEAQAFAAILGKVDPKFLARRHFAESANKTHLSNLEEAKKLLYTNSTKVVSLPLTAEEEAFWGEGVPDQVGETTKAQIWEQCAYAFKLVSSGMTRSVALEFDYVDVHDERTVDQMHVKTLQAVLPLARLIESLKTAGIWERTLVAVYTADGGRAPAAGSQGNEGKNGCILAGGMIKGGYYGDVGVAGDDGDGHVYHYRSPDPVTGQPTSPVTDNGSRLSGAYIWRSVMKALDVPDAACAEFPDVAGVKPCSWLLKA